MKKLIALLGLVFLIACNGGTDEGIKKPIDTLEVKKVVKDSILIAIK
jgi:uncharacterized membrane protein